MSNSINCTSCYSKIDGNKILCPECKMSYHEDCWRKNNSKCIQYGCNGKNQKDENNLNQINIPANFLSTTNKTKSNKINYFLVSIIITLFIYILFSKNNFSPNKSEIELSNELAESEFIKGFNYANENNFEESIKSYQKVIKINPEYLNAYFNLAILYNKKSDYKSLIQIYENLIEINNKKPLSITDLEIVYSGLGFAYFSDKKIDDSIKYLKKSISLKENSKDYYNLGLAYSLKKEFYLAIEFYKKSIALENTDYANYFLALNYEQINDFILAKQTFQKACNLGNKLACEKIKDFINKENEDNKLEIPSTEL